ncbi:hypothetical protein G3N95_40085, partial [Paraburkholderia sp. Tr-20389]|uniref:ESPR-type extended signal peptide-containing protein n=1 Tax=Paraburkholderia sp. Tr-20389 TaxID=2703903 RepID=UPI002402951F
MNKTYRSIWNESTGTWMAAQENAKGRGKRSGKSAVVVALAAAGLVASIAAHAGGLDGGSAPGGASAEAIGSGAVANAANTVAVGSGATAALGYDVAIGSGAVTVAGANNTFGAIAIGGGATAYGDNGSSNGANIAIGYQSVAGNSGATTSQALAVGTNATATNWQSAALGFSSTSSGIYSTALGGSSSATADYTAAVGTYSQATASNASALGYNAHATTANSVALGANSVANSATLGTAGFTPAGGTAISAATAAGGEVSVGTSGNERRITRVAAGLNPTDAVNVSQLTSEDAKVNAVGTATAAALGGGSTFNTATGTLSAPSYVVGGTTVSNIGGAITNIDTRTTQNATSITNLTAQINSGVLGLVQQDPTTRNIKVAAATDGSIVDFTGTGGARKLTGVAAGAVGASSIDAVNGTQLYGVSQSVSNALGGGSSVSATGAVSAPSYALTNANSINGTSGADTDVGTAMTTIDTALGKLNTAIASAGGSGGIMYFHANSTLADSSASGANAVAIGGGALAQGSGAMAIGTGTGAIGNNSLAIGNGVQAQGQGGIAIGNVGTLSIDSASTNAVAIGNIAQVANSTNGVALGNFSYVDNAASGVAVGDSAYSTASDATALGANAQATTANSVALGSNSVANSTTLTTAGYNPGSGTLSAATAAGGEVSVGKAGAERRITNVAAGLNGTDAVNVSQLQSEDAKVGSVATSVANALGGGSTYNAATGAITPPSYVVGGTTVNNIAGALTNVDARVTSMSTDITNLTTQLNSGEVGLVQQDATTRNITVAAATDGTIVDFTGTAGARTLTGVAAGAVNSSSLDAVNGSQLYSVANSTAAALGGGSTVNSDGSISAPSYVIGGTTVNNIAGAMTNVDARVTAMSTDITNLTTQLNSGEVGLVQQDATTRNITVAAATDGTIVDFTGTAGARTLTGVAAGAVNSSSLDAVNGSQLYSVANSTAAALGGGSTVNSDGSISAPSYVIGGTTV